VCAPIKEVRTFSRSPEKRTKFCQDIKARLGIDASRSKPRKKRSPAATSRDIDNVNDACAVRRMALSWNSHHAIGANYEHRRELDSIAVARAKFIATDDTEQVRYESTDLAARSRKASWTGTRSLRSETSSRAT